MDKMVTVMKRKQAMGLQTVLNRFPCPSLSELSLRPSFTLFSCSFLQSFNHFHCAGSLKEL